MNNLTMDNPNESQKVKLITNPVKTFVLHRTFSEREPSVRCQLDSEFINIKQGVWEVAVFNVILLNNLDTQLQTIFDLKTNLSYTCQVVDHKPVTVNECIASIETFFSAKREYVFYEPFDRVFFTVNNSSSDNFTLTLAPSKILSNEHPAYSVSAEIRLFFRRMV
jgi:hypothetical protein